MLRSAEDPISLLQLAIPLEETIGEKPALSCMI